MRDLIQANGAQRSRLAKQYKVSRPDKSEADQLDVSTVPVLQLFNLSTRDFNPTLNKRTAATYYADFLCFGYRPEFARLYDPESDPSVEWGAQEFVQIRKNERRKAKQAWLLAHVSGAELARVLNNTTSDFSAREQRALGVTYHTTPVMPTGNVRNHSISEPKVLRKSNRPGEVRTNAKGPLVFRFT